MLKLFSKKIVLILFLLFISIMIVRRYINLYNNDGYVSYDGAYYAEIARNVAEGKGVLTSNSCFDQSFKELPRVAPVYPLWPIVSGYISKIIPDSIPFEKKIKGISLMFYFLSIILLYYVLCEIFKYPILAAAGSIFFELSNVYEEYGKLTYTEPLFFTLLFTSILVFSYFDKQNGLKRYLIALLLGIIFTLLFISRSQSIVSIAGFGIFSIIYFIKLKELKPFFIIWGSFVLTLIPYLLWIYINRGEHFDISAFIIFQNNYDISLYPPVSHMSSDPFFIRLKEGLLHFFSWGDLGGVTNNGFMVYLYFPFLFVLFFKKIQINLIQKLLLIVGFLNFVTLISLKMTINRSWLFAHRHGLILFLLTITISGIFIQYIIDLNPKKKNIIIMIGVIIILLSIPFSKHIKKADQFQRPEYSHKGIMVDLAHFLKIKEKEKGKKLKIISRSSRPIVYFSRQLGYDIDYRRANWEEYLIYKMKHLNIDYLILTTRYDFYESDVSPYYNPIKENKSNYFNKVFEMGEGIQWMGIYELTSF